MQLLHIDRAVEDLLLSKRFDNGMIVRLKIQQSLKRQFTRNGCKKMQDKGAYLVPKEGLQEKLKTLFSMTTMV